MPQNLEKTRLDYWVEKTDGKYQLLEGQKAGVGFERGQELDNKQRLIGIPIFLLNKSTTYWVNVKK